MKSIEEFLVVRENQGLSRVALHQARVTLGRLTFWMSKRRWAWAELTAPRLGAYMDHVRARRARCGPRQGRPISHSTVFQELRFVRAFARWLVDTDVLLADPSHRLRCARVSTLCGRGVFSPAEIRRLIAQLEAADPLTIRNRAIIAVLYGAGLRIGETMALDLADYDPDEGLLWIRHGKGSKQRVVPLGPEARRDLDLYVRTARPELAMLWGGGSAALFINVFGGRLGKCRVGQILHRLQQAAGIFPRRGAHALRHAFATHMLAGGADIRYLQQFLGHSQLGTTARYTEVDLGDLRRTLARRHPRERRRR